MSGIHSWSELFAATEPAQSPVSVRFKLLRRAGEPLLLVPESPGLAATALSLYPAQRTRARLIREILRQVWRLGIPIAFERVAVSIAPQAPFPKFLAQWTVTGPNEIPPLAILCGNPSGRGRRFVILVFAPDGTPAAVVKAGFGEMPTRFIDREAMTLKLAPPQTPSIPVLRGLFQGQHVHALALDFVRGTAPDAADYDGVGKLLTCWLDTGEPRRLCDLPCWREIESVCQPHPQWSTLAAALRNRRVRPTIFHGDFAPWNIKVSPKDGSWTVLDWDWAELIGTPGWDWFHYVFQYGVLASRLPLTKAAQRMRGLLRHSAFKRYCATAFINGIERELFSAYLIYYNLKYDVPKGGAEFEELLQRLAESWP